MAKRSIQGRRDFLRLSAVATSATLVTACLPAGTPTPTEQELGQSGLRIGPLGSATLVTDSAQFPKSFNEAPELAEMVRAGTLPPVQDRIGQDPLVLKPKDEIGKYGGTIRRGFNGPTDHQNIIRFGSGPDRLLYWDLDVSKVTPWLAKAFELSADGRTLTLQLRRGMKWSDGQPFTADDILFWYNDIYLNPTLTPAKLGALQINGKDVRIVKVDTYTVRYESPDPNPLLPELLASTTDIGGLWSAALRLTGGYAPAHYLRTIHPTYDPAAAEAARAAGNFANVRAMLTNKFQFSANADLPTLAPWKQRKGSEVTTQNWILERNPYYVGVDTAGNQLPYTSGIQLTPGGNLEVINLRAVAGEYDFQDRHMDMLKIPLLKENEERAGYRIYFDPAETGIGIKLNLDYVADPEIGGLYKNVDFRRALSLGVDRDQLNEAFFLGAATPSSYAPLTSNRYSPGQASVDKYAKLDVAEANRLLDGLGYTRKDAEGFRLRKDNGERLRLEIKPTIGNFADFVGMSEMVKTHWRAIGIDLIVNGIATGVVVAQVAANQIQMTVHQVGSDDLFLNPGSALPSSQAGLQALIGFDYVRWFLSDGAQGTRPFPELVELMDLWKRGYAASEQERIAIGKEWWTKAADQVLQIGFVNGDLSIYGIHYAKTNMGNIPARMRNSQQPSIPLNGHPQTFFYK